MATNSTAFALGLGLQVFSTIGSCIGLLVQKLSADVEQGLPVWRRWRFWLGFALNAVSKAVFTNLAVLLLPLSVIAPFSGLSIVINAILAHAGCVPGVKERMGCVEWAATALIMVSVGVVAFAGSAHSEEHMDVVARLSEAFLQPPFIAFACCSTCLAFLWILLFKQQRIPWLLRYRPVANSRLAVVGSALGAGLSGAVGVTFLKATSVGIRRWVTSSTPPSPLMWGCAGTLCFTIPLEFYLLNLALENGRATFALPVFLSSLAMFVSMSGGFLLSEYEALFRCQPAGVWLAVYIGANIHALVGVGILSWQQDSRAMESMGGHKIATSTVQSDLEEQEIVGLRLRDAMIS